jgi:hypothetical protein
VTAPLPAIAPDPPLAVPRALGPLEEPPPFDDEQASSQNSARGGDRDFNLGERIADLRPEWDDAPPKMEGPQAGDHPVSEQGKFCCMN